MVANRTDPANGEATGNPVLMDPPEQANRPRGNGPRTGGIMERATRLELATLSLEG